jgi:hypothetical protein
MITRHHLAFALMCALIVSSAFFFSDPVFVILITTGTCIGVLLPDIHMTRPKHFKLRSFAWLIVQFPRRICAPFLCRIYAGLHHPVEDPGDKRLFHSVPGALFVFSCTGMILLVPADATGNPVVTSAAFVVLNGIFFGLVLHLTQDLCTRKGIFPVFPFSTWMIAGSIRPCDKTDPRIGKYLIQHCTILLVLFALASTGFLTPPQLTLLSVLGLGVCLLLMIRFSDVTPRRAKRDNGGMRLPRYTEQP